MLALAGETPAESSDTDAPSRAFELRANAKYAEAEQLLDQELAERPENARAWFELARLRFHMSGVTRDMDPASEAIGKSVELAPDSALYQCWAARIAVYNGILKAHANDPEAVAEQFKKAAAAAEKAVTLNPDDHAARIILVSLYGNNPPDLQGDKELAGRHLKILEKRSPIDGVAARCEFSYPDNTEERLTLWKKLTGKFDTDPRLHRNLAQEFARSGNLEKADEHARRALALDPDNGQILMDLSRTFALSQNSEAAERFGRRYLAHKPQGPRAHRAWTTFVLAKLRKMSGDDESAEKLLAQAKALDSHLWFTMTPPPPELFDEPPPPTS
jgi:tetratricopeptide (TPR) repeat protein